MSEKENKDKSKEKRTFITLDSQKRMFASLFFSKEAPDDIQIIRPEHFDSVAVKTLVRLFLDFHKDYPTMQIASKGFLEGFNQRVATFTSNKDDKLPISKEELLAVYEEILLLEGEDFTPVQDLFRELARQQAHNKAIDRIIERKLIEKGDYDGIQELMMEAYVAGSRDGGLVEKDLTKVPEKLEFLIEGRIVKGGITFIAGRGGTGKGAFTTGAICAAVTAGGVDFAGYQLEQGFALLFNEEDFESTVLNRLRNNGGNVENLKWLELPEDKNGYSPTFSLKHNIPLLIKKLKQVPEELLTNSILVIDGIGTFMGMKIGSDAYNDVDVRNVLAPLSKIARKFNMAVVIIGHFNKAKTSDLIYAILGSKAFSDISRVVYAIIEDEEEKERHYFLPLKWNTPEIENTGIEFKIEKDTDKIIIVGEISAEDVKDLKAERSPGQVRALRPREEAKRFLTIVLKDGRRSWKEINKMMKANNINQATLYNARNEMGVRTDYDPFGIAWWVWDRQSTDETKKETSASKDIKAKVEEIREEHKEETVEKPKIKVDKRSPEEMAEAVKKIRAKHT